jgi:MoaA/NifB/PqqE/SkfB family radical SAM enzyme
MSEICLFKVLDKEKYWKVTFEITSKCNLFCKHCCTNSTINWSSKLSEDIIDIFLSDLKKNSISDLYITWWEPFLYPHIEKFLEKVLDYWFKISIATNAILLRIKGYDY